MIEMRGTVAHMNPTRGMVAVRTDQGYSIVELLGDDPPDVGDEVRWVGEDTPLGGHMLENLSQGLHFEVFFQNHHVSEGNLRNQLLL